MTMTDRMLTGAIANNPGNFAGDGEYRYSIARKQIYFTSAANPNQLDNEKWIALPSLDPDGSKRKERAFKQFIRRRWRPSRQSELERFALKKGWDLAMELKYGGGALEDYEAEEWQYVINRELERLARQAREQIVALQRSA